jgi:hypothetical protein
MVLVARFLLGGHKDSLAHQWYDDLAVRVRLERVGRLEALAYPAMVVDLAVDGQNDAVVLVGQRLRAGLDADDAEPLMAEDCGRLTIATHTRTRLDRGP